MTNKIWIISLAWLFCLPALAFESSFKDRFVGDLISSGDPFRALTILKELEFGSRGTSNGLVYSRKILGLYVQAGEYDAAEAWLNRLIQFYPSVQKNYRPTLLKAELSYLYGNYFQTLKLLETLNPDQREPLYTFASVAMKPGIETVNPLQCQTGPCGQLQNELIEFRKSNPPKSKGLALALGIIPGMGQIYAGNIWGGLSSFVLNGFLVGATAFAATRGEVTAAAITGVVGGAFYLSSIYAGFEATRRYNEALDVQEIRKIKSISIQMDLLKLTF